MSISFFLSVRSAVRWLQDTPDGIFPGQIFFFFETAQIHLKNTRQKEKNGEENNYEWKREEKQREGREEKKL